MAKPALVFLILSAVSVLTPRPALATCGQEEVIAAQQVIRLGCDCSGATGRAAYLACARATIATEIAEDRLSPACRGKVQRFAAASTCGRPSAVACCIQSEGRPWRGTIRRDAAACRAPRTGSSCVAPLPHLADACHPDTGCNDAICGNGEVEAAIGEQCEPPGTASCDSLCHFNSTCGNGVIEPGEECDGQPVCTGCRLNRAMCCQTGDSCLGAGGGLARICFEVVGALSNGACEGETESCQEIEGVTICNPGSCVDGPIDPVPLCCQEAEGTCRDTIATTAGAIGAFPCVQSPPPEDGNVDRLMLGSCGADGRCVPAG